MVLFVNQFNTKLVDEQSSNNNSGSTTTTTTTTTTVQNAEGEAVGFLAFLEEGEQHNKKKSKARVNKNTRAVILRFIERAVWL